MHRKVKWIFCVGLSLLAVVLAALVFKDIRGTIAARPETDPVLIRITRDNLGTGCPFGNSGPTEVVNNLANFLSARSTVVLSQAVKNRLITLENQTMYEGRPRKTLSEISAGLSDTWFERLGQLTNAQIYEIGECTRTAVDAPFEGTCGFMARSNGQLTFSDMSEWMSHACAYRDASTADGIMARGATPGLMSSEVDKRLQVYEEALPNEWNRTTGFTPAQAFLLAYSVVTDDMLHFSADQLTGYMRASERELRQYYPGLQTSCANRKAFGYMGYMYSTHTVHLFNETVQNRLIDRF